MLSESFSHLDVMAISKYFADICSCVFCWEVKNSKNCSKCAKKYCIDHYSKHLCFKNSEVWN